MPVVFQAVPSDYKHGKLALRDTNEFTFEYFLKCIELPQIIMWMEIVRFAKISNRTMKSTLKFLACLVFAGMPILCSCGEKSGNEEKPFVKPTPKRSFELFDAMYYTQKPDFGSVGIQRIQLLYENKLLSGSAIDWKVVANTIANTKAGKYKVVSLDIEQWYSKKPSTETASLLDTLYKAFKKEMPDVIIGNYGTPCENLNVMRFNLYSSGKTADDVLKRWKAQSTERRLKTGGPGDILMPSVYGMNHDIDQWVEDLKTTIQYIRETYPDKLVYAYVWPQCYNWKTAAENPDYMTFYSGEEFERILNALYDFGYDGAIIWASGCRDMNESPRVYIPWSDPRIQDWYSGVLRFIDSHPIKTR